MNRGPDPAAVLRRRTAALARPAVEPGRVATSDVLVVTVAGRELGLDGRHVSQVLPGRGLCRLPHGCGALTSLVSSRGSAVPVADLGRLLGSEGSGSRSFVVLLTGDAPPVGVLVDAVHEMRAIAVTDVHPVPGALESTGVEVGMTADGLVVLDVARLLADPRLHPHSSTPDHPRTPHPQENHVSDDHR